MYRHTSGFALIELVIAITVASILSLMLFGFVRQTTRSSARTAAAVEHGLALSIAYAQIERDVMAIMISESAFASYKRGFKQEKRKKEEKLLTKTDETKKEGEGADGASEDTAEKRTKEIPPPFSAKFQGDRLELLYLTTTNRMPRHKVFVPHNTRVIYRLVPAGDSGTWNLERAESGDIRVEVKELLEKNITSHVLLGRLKSLSMKFFVPEETGDDSKDGSKGDEEKDGGKRQSKSNETREPEKIQKIVYEELNEWDPVALKKAPYLVPAYLEIVGTRLESDGKTEQPFKMSCKIPIFAWQHERLKKIVEERTKVKKKVIKEKGVEGTGTAAGGVAGKRPMLSVGKPGSVQKPSLPRRAFGGRSQSGSPQMRVQ